MRGLRVLNPGALATIQDLGRTGYQRYGVPQSGAMDEFTFRIANLLAGNAEDEAAIEFTLIGGSYALEGVQCRVGVAGTFTVSLNGALAPSYRAFDLRPGDLLKVGPGTGGARGYLAVAGGFEVPPVLGSRSTHVRSGIGGIDGGPLVKGTLIALRAPRTGPGPALALDPRLARHDPGPMRIVPGPQDDYFDDSAWETLLGNAYRMDPQSDRMGLRLGGPRIMHAEGFNIVSDGIAAGSIQIPGSGLPIVLLADRQPTGGYPKIATAISADLARLGQLRPGDRVRFARVSIDEAESLAFDLRNRISTLHGAFRAAGR